MTERATTTTVAGRNIGRTTCHVFCQPFAPSIDAASVRSAGTAVSPARKITIESPICCQDHARITERSALSGFASHANVSGSPVTAPMKVFRSPQSGW